MLAAELRTGCPGTVGPSGYWGPFRVCHERPVASKPTEPTEGLNFLPLHLQPLALIPNPDNLTSHHQSASKQGLLSLKAWG